MKKTRVMSTIAMVCFIIALVWDVVNDIVYLGSAFKYNFEGSLIVRVICFDTIPTLVGIILLIISAKKARTGANPPQYKLGFFFLAGALLLNLVISIIVAGGITGSYDYVIKTVILIGAYMLVAFDSILALHNKVMGIIGSAVIIAVAIIYSFVYTLNLTKDMGSFYSSSDMADYYINLLTIVSYYSMLQLIGVGALLMAIGRQPKDNAQIPPAYPNSGGYQYNNQNNLYNQPQQYDNQYNGNQYNYVPPQQDNNQQ